MPSTAGGSSGPISHPALQAPCQQVRSWRGACQIPILSHAETMIPSDAFVDDSMDRQDALAASPRFTVHRTPEGIRVQLQEGDTDPGTGLTIDRVLALLESLLEQGRAVTIHD